MKGVWMIMTAILVAMIIAKCRAKDALVQGKTSGNNPVKHNTIRIGDLDISYRESGPLDAPVILLMHGYPSSSFMFRNLIPLLNNKYRLIAPDYPGFGYSSVPSPLKYQYSFENLANTMEQFVDALKIDRFSIYIQDYGAPVGLRLISKRPELLQCLIVQNGNAYQEGLSQAWEPLKAIWSDKNDPVKRQKVFDFMSLEGTRFQYLSGVSDSSILAQDTWTLDQSFLDRPGVKDIQYELFYDYQNNVREYPAFHKMFREHQPPTLIVWGEKDVFFTKEGALAYGRDLKNIEFNFYNTGHFALEEHAVDIANKIDSFLKRNLRN